MRIGLLTGTFDPVHLGHTELAQAARAALALDEVWFLVNPLPGHKSLASTYADRSAMVSLALTGEGLKTGEPVEHTLAGFRRLMGRFPEHQFVFIVGLDTVARLDRWENYPEIVRSQSFAVAHRPGTPVSALEQLRQRLGPLGTVLRAELFDFNDHGTASSTAIRRAVREGHQPGWLSPDVARYIESRHLYH